MLIRLSLVEKSASKSRGEKVGIHELDYLIGAGMNWPRC